MVRIRSVREAPTQVMEVEPTKREIQSTRHRTSTGMTYRRTYHRASAASRRPFLIKLWTCLLHSIRTLIRNFPRRSSTTCTKEHVSAVWVNSTDISSPKTPKVRKSLVTTRDTWLSSRRGISGRCSKSCKNASLILSRQTSSPTWHKSRSLTDSATSTWVRMWTAATRLGRSPPQMQVASTQTLTVVQSWDLSCTDTVRRRKISS